MREVFGSILLGAAGGLAVGLVIAFYASRSLDRKMTEGAATLTDQFGAGRHELDRQLAQGRRDLDRLVREHVATEVPPVVRTTVAHTFADYGLTPDTGRQISRVLSYAESAGLIGLRSRYR